MRRHQGGRARALTGRLPSRTMAWLAAALLGLAFADAQAQQAEPDSLPALRPYAPGTLQQGAGATGNRPGYATLRSDEDWSWLADPTRRTDPLDPLKYVVLSWSDQVFMTFGGDARFSVRDYDNEAFGQGRGGNTALYVRLNPYASIQFGDRLRLFGALKYGDLAGKRALLPPAERDRVDLHEAFAEVAFGDLLGLDERDTFVRVGRMELHYGAGRLISIREKPNVRRDFDGGLVRLRLGPMMADAFLVEPTTDSSGSFDNRQDHRQTLWGFYTSTALPGRSNLDLFYIGYRRGQSPYDIPASVQAPGAAGGGSMSAGSSVGGMMSTPVDETRHIIGARWWRGGDEQPGWLLDMEAGMQAGDAAGRAGRRYSVFAWYAAGRAEYLFGDVPLRPSFGVDFGVNSGDGNAAGGHIGTFRAPFPPGRFFGEANPIGPGNIAGLRPLVAIRPAERLTLQAEANVFWRVSTRDGIYTVADTPLRGTLGSRNYVGTDVTLVATYRIGPHTTLEAKAARFFPGGYLADNRPNLRTTYLELTASYRF